MIKPFKNYWYIKLLDVFLDYKFKSRFHAVHYLIDKPVSQDCSLLVIGNHSTWWDGFIGWQLGRYVLHKNFFLMMLETSLKQLWFFQKIGCFSINPGSRSVVDSLNCAVDLLSEPSNMVIFFPQGKLHSLYNHEFTFQSGVEKIITKCSQTNLLFYAAFFDYGPHEKPVLNIYMKEYSKEHLVDKNVNKLYQLFYDEVKLKQIQNFKA